MKLPVFGFILYFFLLSRICVFAQVSVYGNRQITTRVDTTLNYIYNLDFVNASVSIRNIEGQLGSHPAVLLLKAQLIFWKNRPLVKGTTAYQDYESYLKQVIEVADNNFNREGFEMERNFYLMSGYSLLTEQYGEDKDYWRVLTTSKYAYAYLKNGMGREKELPDYYFTTGLYNYYRVKYPELHPFYKPFLWFFIDGDKDMGIEYLKKASEKSLFLKELSYIYLFHIYLRYENNPLAALPYAKYLAESFPRNLRFITLYAEALLCNKNYKSAAPFAEILSIEKNKLFSIPGYLFRGMIAEHNNKISEARRYYNYSLSLAGENEGEDDHFVGMNYAGLARLELRENNIDAARDYYKLAYKTEPYIPVKAEANAFFEKYD